jgi:glyoxylase-like metal-dependent hydrolase (beta-lactamase superfamily II)
MDSGWFYVRETRPGLWLIAEPAHVYTWMVVGSERACLFDTGTGIAPIRPVVEAITDLPVTVVNSHYHFDHVGGDHEFERVAIHRLGAGELFNDRRDRLVDGYLDMIGGWDGDVAAFRELDANLFALMTAELDPRPLPAGVAERIAVARAAPRPAVKTLEDGDTIELGDRVLQVLHTPGHSPDGISLLDAHHGVLLTADAFNVGLVYCHYSDSSLADLRATAGRLAALSSEVGYVTGHHYPRVIAEPNLMVAYRDALERIEDVATTAISDIFGQACRLATFDQVAITLPDPDPAAPAAIVG